MASAYPVMLPHAMRCIIHSALLDGEQPPVFPNGVAVSHACDVVGNCLMFIRVRILFDIPVEAAGYRNGTL